MTGTAGTSWGAGMPTKAIPVLAAVSVLPGLCMMLALSLGVAIGVRRTLWMMVGELTGLAIVSLLALTGVAAVMFSQPDVYSVAKVLSGCYLLYIGAQIALVDVTALATGEQDHSGATGHLELIQRGFVAAISNPKAWILYASLLPPFIRSDASFTIQVITLVALLIIIEFLSLLLYASCGQAMRRILGSPGFARTFFALAGAIIIGFGVELILGL